MKILIADDSAVIRAQLSDILTTAGFQVSAAVDGIEAWNALRDGEYRLAVIDWVMPGMDGVDVCARLAKRNKGNSTYVIVLTSRNRPDEMAQAFELGASDYVTKPFSEVELLARVRAGKRIVELQSRLAHSQKLESIGQLAAGLSHELNTPIQYIGDNLRFVSESMRDIDALLALHQRLDAECASGAPSAALLAETMKAAHDADLAFLRKEMPQALHQSLSGLDKVSRIVNAMKDFSQPAGEQKQAIDLNQALESTLTVTRSEWKDVATVVTDFDSTLPQAPCVPADFNQAIANLIVNAAHAIQEIAADGRCGEITISTRSKDEFAEIRIADNGAGIPNEIRQRIFDPFFTTKPVGKGTGQGLAIVYATIVDQHAGQIEVESEVGVGTTFVLRLPYVSKSELAEAVLDDAPVAVC